MILSRHPATGRSQPLGTFADCDACPIGPAPPIRGDEDTRRPPSKCLPKRGSHRQRPFGRDKKPHENHGVRSERATVLRRIVFYLLYLLFSLPSRETMPERTSELWNCSGVMPLTRLAIEAVNSAVVSCFALDETLAVPTILVDVPDREDVLLVADADLDVCFFINPTPLPDPFSTLGRNVDCPSRVYWPRGLARERVVVVKDAQSRFLCWYPFSGISASVWCHFCIIAACSA
jgi:hypothetical protein